VKNKFKKVLILILSLSGLSIVLAGCGASVPGVSVNPKVKPDRMQSLTSFTKQVANNAKTYHFAGKTILVAEVQLHYNARGVYKSGYYAPSKDFYRYCKMVGGTYKINSKGMTKRNALNDFILKVDRMDKNKSDVFHSSTARNYLYGPRGDIHIKQRQVYYARKHGYETRCIKNSHTFFKIIVNNYITNSYIYYNGYLRRYNMYTGRQFIYLSTDVLNVIY
jgi:hypothetical protein